jgi:long-chain acyl-CoA synthetase
MASINELIEKGQEQIKQGNRKFLDVQINPEEMNIMLFTSGTTSESKAVALSHKNI